MVADLDLGLLQLSQGIKIVGATSGDQSGFSVETAGDFNGDGYDDVIVGAIWADPSSRSEAGISYIIYGSSSPVNIDLASLTTSQGISIFGASSGGWNGWSVAPAGDFNNDGYDDVIVGARHASPSSSRSGAGISYVIYGSRSPTNIDLASLTSSQGIAIFGTTKDGQSGISVASAGDINKDGFGDFMIGAYRTSPLSRSIAGTAYVIYGAQNLVNINLSSLTTSQGIAIYGASANDGTGNDVASAGDVNGDGYNDIIVSSHLSDPSGKTNAGKTFIIYGGKNLVNIDLASITTSQGIAIIGESATDFNGFSVSSAGDFNGDGYYDIISGALQADPSSINGAGTSYVIFGGQNLVNIELVSLSASQGMKIYGAASGDASGFSVASIGNIKGNGCSSVIIGAYGADPSFRSNAGASYVIYGNCPTSSPTILPTSKSPSCIPSFKPSILPTQYATTLPSFVPSNKPTEHPIVTPTSHPTIAPSSAAPTINTNFYISAPGTYTGTIFSDRFTILASGVINISGISSADTYTIKKSPSAKIIITDFDNDDLIDLSAFQSINFNNVVISSDTLYTTIYLPDNQRIELPSNIDLEFQIIYFNSNEDDVSSTDDFWTKQKDIFIPLISVLGPVAYMSSCGFFYNNYGIDSQKMYMAKPFYYICQFALQTYKAGVVIKNAYNDYNTVNRDDPIVFIENPGVGSVAKRKPGTTQL